VSAVDIGPLFAQGRVIAEGADEHAGADIAKGGAEGEQRRAFGIVRGEQPSGPRAAKATVNGERLLGIQRSDEIGIRSRAGILGLGGCGALDLGVEVSRGHGREPVNGRENTAGERQQGDETGAEARTHCGVTSG